MYNLILGPEGKVSIVPSVLLEINTGAEPLNRPLLFLPYSSKKFKSKLSFITYVTNKSLLNKPRHVFLRFFLTTYREIVEGHFNT